MKVLLCLKDFIMKEGDRTFTKGRTYPILDSDDTDEVEGSEVTVRNDDGYRHILPFYADDTVSEWFEVQESN